MAETRIITAVLDEEKSSHVTDQLRLNLDVEFVNLKTTQQLVRMITSDNYHTDLVILDIKKLSTYSGVGLLDMIMALKTLITCACTSKVNTISDIPIGISVNSNTDPRLIREVLSTNRIAGLYPDGDEFSIEEKELSIHALINNEHHVPVRIHKMLNEKKNTKKTKLDKNEIKLTPRQQQILDLIVNKGASNKLIARILNISESTVKLHMTQILKKHGLTNRTQLALFTKSKNIDCSTK